MTEDELRRLNFNLNDGDVREWWLPLCPSTNNPNVVAVEYRLGVRFWRGEVLDIYIAIEGVYVFLNHVHSAEQLIQLWRGMVGYGDLLNGEEWPVGMVPEETI